MSNATLGVIAGHGERPQRPILASFPTIGLFCGVLAAPGGFAVGGAVRPWIPAFEHSERGARGTVQRRLELVKQ